MKIFFSSLLILLLCQLSTSAQQVGIGTTNPISMLSVDGGINVDQSNSNGFGSLNSALTFGNNKRVGIASNRTSQGNVQMGLDLYTGGLRRLSIDSNGRVGIGITSPSYLLDVFGTTRISSLLVNERIGIGFIPDYPLHTNIGYFSTRLGIGTIPNTTYALDLLGSTRLQGNVRVTGNVTTEGNLLVQDNKGIVRSNTGTQYKTVPFNVTFTNISIGPNASLDISNVSYGESFGGTPRVFVGQLVSGTGTSGNYGALQVMPVFSNSNSSNFRITNNGNTTAVFSTITFACLAIGPQ